MDKDRSGQGATASAGKAAREAKLAAALRVNLTRRKAAARAAIADAEGGAVKSDLIENKKGDGQA